MNFSPSANVSEEAWGRTLELLKDVVKTEDYEAWLSDLRYESFDEEIRHLVLSVRNTFFKKWIERKFLEPIRAALHDTVGYNVSVEIILRDEDDASPRFGAGGDDEFFSNDSATLSPRAAATQDLFKPTPSNGGGSPLRAPAVITAPTSGDGADRPRLNPRYSFNDFIVGESNRYAHAAAQSVAEPRSQAFNPLFLYGPSGLGKTHLMQAIGHAFWERDRSKHVLYVTSEQFTNRMVESIISKRTVDFRNEFRNVDLLLLDDVQFLMGKEQTQQEVFHTFNALFDAGKKIVLTSDRPPKDLATLEERLRSRFEWGVIADIQPPDLETRIAILRYKARMEALPLPGEVVAYVAERVKSNIRELEGVLKRLRVYASLHSVPITLDVCREVIGHLNIGAPPDKVTVEDVQRAVCDYFEVSVKDLLGNNRSKKFSQPRHIALYLARTLTDLSFPDIAQQFGGKDHTSVIYACRKIKQTSETDDSMASILAHLTKQINKGRAD